MWLKKKKNLKTQKFIWTQHTTTDHKFQHINLQDQNKQQAETTKKLTLKCDATKVKPWDGIIF